MEINIEKNKETIMSLIKSLNRSTCSMLEYLEMSDYFNAPASSKFHLNIKGGLAQHSLNVMTSFEKTLSQYGFCTDEHRELIIVCGLLHDLCKTNYYKPNILKSGNISDSIPYKIEDMMPLGHAEKSVIIIKEYMDLTLSETCVIRWHMGMFDRAFMENQRNIQDKFPLAVLFHTCDWNVANLVDPKYHG